MDVEHNTISKFKIISLDETKQKKIGQKTKYKECLKRQQEDDKKKLHYSY